MILMNGAFGRTLRLLFASYDELIFRLRIPPEHWLCFEFCPRPILFPSSSYQAVPHAYWLEFKLRKYNSMSNGSLGSPCAQIWVQSILWVGIFKGRIFLHKIDKMTCYPSHFLSDLKLYTKELICVLFIDQTTCNPSLSQGLYEDWRGYINRTINSELSSGFVWELKKLPLWNYSHSELLSSHWLHLSSGSAWWLKGLQYI